MPAEQISAASSPGWAWDPTLYAGAARYYTRGRVAYPAAVADALVTTLGLDGTGGLLDVGCGPGSLTLLLAPHFARPKRSRDAVLRADVLPSWRPLCACVRCAARVRSRRGQPNAD